MTPSPVVARWELSRRLATRRRELQIDVKSVTAALGFSRNYWSAVENDRTLIAEDKLRMLFHVLEFSQSDQAELLELRAESRKRGWWDEYPSLDEVAKRFYGMEYGAQRIQSYEGHIIPGALQIAAYSRALLEADAYFSPLDVEAALAVRRHRGMHLLADPQRQMTLILSEAALRQQVAGPRVQAKQLRHLIDVVETSSAQLVLHVLPLSTNPGVIAGSSTLLFFDYPGRQLPRVAFQEAVRLPDLISEDDDQFRRLELAWSDGLRRSLEPPPSLSMVSEIAGELDRSPTD